MTKTEMNQKLKDTYNVCVGKIKGVPVYIERSKVAMTDFFKDKRSMYIFLLIWVKGRAKNKMLGLSDDVIKSSEKIHSTAKYIASVIKSEEDENTALALACLCKTCRSIYSNLNIQNHS